MKFIFNSLIWLFFLIFTYNLLGEFMNNSYIVKKGDTLWGISNQFGVSVTELSELNGVNAATLKIGQVLKIPTNSGTNPDNMFMYTVKKGDTLWSIARVYGTSVEEIKKLNYFTSNDLYIGQVIRIPEIYTKEKLFNKTIQRSFIWQSLGLWLSLSKIVFSSAIRTTNFVL